MPSQRRNVSAKWPEQRGPQPPAALARLPALAAADRMDVAPGRPEPQIPGARAVVHAIIGFDHQHVAPVVIQERGRNEAVILEHTFLSLQGLPGASRAPRPCVSGTAAFAHAPPEIPGEHRSVRTARDGERQPRGHAVISGREDQPTSNVIQSVAVPGRRSPVHPPAALRGSLYRLRFANHCLRSTLGISDDGVVVDTNDQSSRSIPITLPGQSAISALKKTHDIHAYEIDEHFWMASSRVLGSRTPISGRVPPRPAVETARRFRGCSEDMSAR